MSDDDAEVAALAAFQQQVTRARLSIGLPCIGVGLVLGVVGAIWVHQLAIDAGFSGGAAMTIALAGFAPPVAIALVGGVIAARRLTNAKKGAWLDALAAEHGVPPERLREVAEIFD